jgi:putative nucleotidyltransferase with HDIG domain
MQNLTPEAIQQKVLSIIQLPALPSMVTQVVELIDNPRTSAASLGKVISTDQALTAKVLKIANSPFYGFPKKISTVDFAIIVLGFDALKEIVISISLVSSLQKKSDATFDAQSFWDHSIMSAVIARRLARDLGYRVSGEAFVGALLHDMGISVLHRYFNSEFKKIVALSRESTLSFLEAEQKILGVTHAEVGSWLAERWNLPDNLIETIAFHHTPAKAKQNRPLVSLIHLADVFAGRMATKDVEFDKGLALHPDALTTLDMDEAGAQGYMESYTGVIQADMEQALQRNAFAER